MNDIHRIIIIILGLCLSTGLLAQNGPDPVRAGMFYTYAKQAKRALKAQDALLAANLTGHKYLKEEVEITTNLQREFDKYLTNLSDVLTEAANIYAICMEIDESLRNMKAVRRIVVRQPGNVLAVALSRSRSNIYADFIETGTRLIDNIKVLLPLKKDQSKNTKMTQYERLKIEDDIRQDLRTFNRKLRTLSRLISYTTIMDSWYELKGTGKEYQPRKMGTITKDCLKSWMSHAKSVKY